MQTVLQTQTSECGLACLAMISSAFGNPISLAEMRRRYDVSMKGLSLSQLIKIAADLGLSPRPIRIELDEIHLLTSPCILHWDLQHFVVLAPKLPRKWWPARLASGRADTVKIIDPAHGPKHLRLSEVSPHFTGVVIQFTRATNFVRQHRKLQPARLRDVIGELQGLGAALGGIFAIALLLEMFAVAAPLFSQIAIDEAISGNDADTVAVIGMCFVGLLLMQTAVAALRAWLIVRLTQDISIQWASNIFSHLLSLPLAYFERRHTGDISSRFRSVDQIRQLLTTRTIESIIDGILASVSLVIMFLYSVKLASITLGAMCLYALLRSVLYGPFKALAADALVLQSKENTFFLESLRSMLQIRLFGHHVERSVRWQHLFAELQDNDLRRSKLEIQFTSANMLLMGLENIFVIWVAATMIAQPQATQFSVGMLLAFMSFKFQFGIRVSNLVNYFFDVKALSVHIERLADIVLTESEPIGAAALAGETVATLPASIELRDVRFRYGDSEPWILDGLNLMIKEGENVALTGPSGAGKSTLMKLLLGVLQPTSGTILFGGVELRCLSLDQVRAQIGVVLQDDVLMTGSIAQNIAFFSPEHDQNRVAQCAQLAQIHDEISAMPMGYHSLIGDLGSGLSGGQRQRIMLARALYKRPRILLLDEATSHLDVANERAVGAAIASIPLTRLVIAHREETIRAADRTVHMAKGRIGAGIN